MEIVNIAQDGTVTVKMTAREAKEVREDLVQIWADKISQSGDKLHSLLEWANPKAGS